MIVHSGVALTIALFVRGTVQVLNDLAFPSQSRPWLLRQNFLNRGRGSVMELIKRITYRRVEARM